MDYLSADHFLSLPRPDILIGAPAGVPDTTTLAAHDFDVDTRTGFMPPQDPVSRLPSTWEAWEAMLDEAISLPLKLGDDPSLQELERQTSEQWRQRVRELPIIPIDDLKRSETMLRRAHLVLAWVMHFYIHSLPPSAPARIPPPISLPLLQVSAQLQLPPLLTYSDDVLYNWRRESGDSVALPTPSNIRCQTTFTSTNDEAEFYLVPARMELVGVEALELMRSSMDEIFVGDDIAVRRITEYLIQMVEVIHRLRTILLEIKLGCDPQIFYHKIRPWFRGEDSQSDRKWTFEGMDQDPSLLPPIELSGPSAGQSSLIHALDIFLGVDKYSHSKDMTGHDAQVMEATRQQKSAFLDRMQLYMPRHHRAFLNHLANNPRPLRDLVHSAATSTTSDSSCSDAGSGRTDGEALLDAYNAAVLALKELRDAHMIIVALYIIGPARHHRKETSQDPQSSNSGVLVESEFVRKAGEDAADKPFGDTLKGTGGTDLVRFLRGVRDQTEGALMSV